MTDYQNIKTMDDLDAAIERNQVKKKIIREELRKDTKDMTSFFSSPNLIARFLGLEISTSFRSKTFTLLRSAVIIFSAFKGGMDLLRKIQRLWK